MTDKFQVTITKDVRKSIGLRPGEEVTVEEAPGGAIIVKRFGTVADPLAVLIAKKPRFRRHIPVDELEEMSESR